MNQVTQIKMARNIQTFFLKASITVLTKDSQVTFSTAGEKIALFTTACLTAPMLDELGCSKIVEVERYTRSGESGAVILYKKIGFDNRKFTKLLIYLIEKYEL
jgi:hypothetical protein